MGSYINVFLKTEITIIPGLLDKYVGNYYNNMLCNGATWMFFFWFIIHIVFDKSLNALLRQMKYKEYQRTRLKQSLWYLGFYTVAAIFCAATISRHDLTFFEEYRLINNKNSTNDANLILGFLILATFFLHSACWEKLKYEETVLGATYLCYFLIMVSFYYIRLVEHCFKFSLLVFCTQVALEITRLVVLLVQKDTFLKLCIMYGLCIASCLIFIIDYFVAIIEFIYPGIIHMQRINYILLILLLVWVCLEGFKSIVFKGVLHYFNTCDFFRNCAELDAVKAHTCPDVLYCAVLPPRTDEIYLLMQLRKDIKMREEESISKRKNKNKSMMMQTLKCMVAMKRKVSRRRLLESQAQEELSSETDSTNETIIGGKLQFNLHENEMEGVVEKNKDD